jgi:SAM-dependent methyltransferase
MGTETKRFYTDAYRVEGHNYGEVGAGSPSGSRAAEQLVLLDRYMREVDLRPTASVLEVGCGVGHLHGCHPGWHGIEYSSTAVDLARRMYGPDLPITEGDARQLPCASGSVDFLFSFAALEHVPDVHLAFEEIARVLRPGGWALLSPAWNCRSWTVKKLQQRPYSELGLAEKIGKLLIPLRDHVLYRGAMAFPRRLARELRLSSGQSVPLDYRRLEPDLTLWDRYPHISDDDAFVSIDAHSALVHLASRGWKSSSHPTFWRRLTCGGIEILVQKPRVPSGTRGPGGG